ncbi:MAG: hypothetical protein ACRDG5_01900 [Anaerolineales bacterium]
MTAMDRIAHFQGRRDEIPNQRLARDLAARKDESGIREIVEGLSHSLPAVQADCVKVLYEVGYLDPKLVAGYVGDFLGLLASKDNRLVWGGMTALSTVAGLRPKEIYDHRNEILQAMAGGSVITLDAAVLTLAVAAATSPARRRGLLPHLMSHLSRCRPKDVPRHSEKILRAVDHASKAAFLRVLERRLPELTSAQQARVRKVMRQVENLQDRRPT